MAFRPLCCALLLVLPSLVLVETAHGQDQQKYNKNQRILRIRKLGKTDAHVIPVLSEYLNDPDADIRFEAVQAIVRLGTDASLTPLVSATHDKEEDIQVRATDGLVNFYLPGYASKGGLSGRIQRGTRQVKGYFSQRNDQKVAADVEIRDDVAQALNELITRGDTMESRANAARAAGILRDHAALPGLQNGIRSKDTQLILESLVALQKIGDHASGLGVSFLANDLNDRVQMTALETIGILHDESAASELRICLRTSRNKEIRRSALKAIAELGLPEDRQLLKQYLQDQDPALRQAALEGLGRIREPEDTAVLKRAYDEPNADWRVHLAAAFGMVNQGDVSSGDFSPLAYLVQNLKAGTHADEAESYLTELGKREEVRRALFPLVSDGNAEQKQALCRVLAESRNADVVPTLTAMSHDINPDVSLTASRCLRIAETRKP